MIHEQYYFHSELKPDMCDSIIQIGHEIGFKPNGLFSKDNNSSSSESRFYMDPKERSSSGATIPKSYENNSISEMVHHYFMISNMENFNFDISHGLWEMQVVKYESKTRDHFLWHKDMIYDRQVSCRKISMTIQLSDSESYEGGDLLFFEDGERTNDNYEEQKEKYRDRGTIICFHSLLRHCVKPVTKGVRYCLVAWINGPPFR